MNASAQQPTPADLSGSSIETETDAPMMPKANMDTLSAAEKVEESIGSYRKLRTYRDTGTFEMIRERPQLVLRAECEFSTVFDREGGFKFSILRTAPRRKLHPSLVWSADHETYNYWSEHFNSATSRSDKVLAYALLNVDKGFADTLVKVVLPLLRPSIGEGDGWPTYLSELEELKDSGTETIDEVACWIIEGKDGKKHDVKIWMDDKLLIRKYVIVSEYNTSELDPRMLLKVGGGPNEQRKTTETAVFKPVINEAVASKDLEVVLPIAAPHDAQKP